MKTDSLLAALLSAALLQLVPLSCLAGGKETPKQDAAKQAVGNTKPGVPADWWTKSSLASPILPPQILYHIQGTLSFMDARGNTNGSVLNGSSGFDVRKLRFTDRTNASFARQDISYFAQGHVNYSELTLRNELEFDLTPHALLVGGIEDYRNTLMFMDRRLTEYFGGGVTISGENGRQTLELIAGIGYANFTFDRDGISHINPAALAELPTLTPSSGGALGMEIWHWKVSPRLALMQGTSYMEYFDTVLGHKWTFDAEANMPISKIFSTVVGFHLKDENNVFVNELGVKPQDREVTVGLKVSH
ncbi:MAG TPA: DUF481 domain-containing protein [Bryobacteraceae bacterium]